jgi:hypothetical protein
LVGIVIVMVTELFELRKSIDGLADAVGPVGLNDVVILRLAWNPFRL